jgi:hypothetical protein
MLQYLDLLVVTIKSNAIVAQDSASTALRKLCNTRAELISDLHEKLLYVLKEASSFDKDFDGIWLP